MAKVMIFRRFERFWHWSQALLIFSLLLTGFEIHGSYPLLGFTGATQLHTIAAWALIVLWLFAIFWHITTGEWRQYIPTRNGLWAVAHYYLIGTFTGASHPYRKTSKAKHNPLQRLAYLFFKLMISPVVWVSGLLYLFYSQWPEALSNVLSLQAVANVHTIAAFAMMVFIIGHVYMTTLGHTLFSHIKPMVTGYDTVDEPDKKP
ncbi:cytochrome B561 [Marinobacter psychrophilus]|jgi:thiosulfate reductase cytochrome b subunit|uniref:Cytochrome B561 n=1 Tax=Marinobacter psychrophilus TaxID=330734 RepID=A0A0H4HWF4_9GAMM|nr:cytochrome b/b6 domain-containing protein [Marinobacter psychrophilus]AKO51019.1 cytochrome B561 [Marinobacter psychrophilus]